MKLGLIQTKASATRLAKDIEINTSRFSSTEYKIRFSMWLEGLGLHCGFVQQGGYCAGVSTQLEQGFLKGGENAWMETFREPPPITKCALCDHRPKT